MDQKRTIWAIADLHLSFGVKDKQMDVFGEEWVNWTGKIEKNWREKIKNDDLVLIAGDISWAMHLEDAMADLEWIDQLPGEKVLIRGNHDYWWSSVSKIRKALPKSIHIIQNDAFEWHDTSIAGARLWDTPEYHFNSFIILKENKRENALTHMEEDPEKIEKIFLRELGRLELSLKHLNQDASRKIVMTHYPPISADLTDSRVSKLLEKYNVDTCVFGHLHSVRGASLPFGEKNGIRYHLTSCDYLNFIPLEI